MHGRWLFTAPAFVVSVFACCLVFTLIYPLYILCLRSYIFSNKMFLFTLQVVFFGLQFLFRRRELGYGLMAAFVEVNTIFMHIRQLLRMYDIPKLSPIFRINNMLYIVSFIINRVPSFVLMMVFLVGDRDRMSPLWNGTVLIGTAVLLYVNVYLFKKLLTSDYLVQ